MNTEYINLQDNKSEVKDENGNIKKNDTKVNDKILMLENKIKKVKEEKEKIKIDLKEAKKEISRALFILNLKSFIFAAAMIGSFSLGGMLAKGFLFSGATAAIATGFGLGLLVSSVILNEYKSKLKRAEKQVEELEIKFEESDKLEKKYENELENAKELLDTNEIKETLEPISLKEKNEIELPKIEKEIEEKTENKIEEKQKKLVLKK